MICKECAWEADGKKRRRFVRCPVCAREKVVNPVHWTIYAHTLNNALCGGSGEPVQLGHDACKGCDCHHQPAGSHLPAEVVDVDARTIEVYE